MLKQCFESLSLIYFFKKNKKRLDKYNALHHIVVMTQSVILTLKFTLIFIGGPNHGNQKNRNRIKILRCKNCQ